MITGNDQRSRESGDDNLVSHRSETNQVFSNSLNDVVEEDTRSDFDINSVLGSVHTHNLLYWFMHGKLENFC